MYAKCANYIDANNGLQLRNPPTLPIPPNTPHLTEVTPICIIAIHRRCTVLLLSKLHIKLVSSLVIIWFGAFGEAGIVGVCVWSYGRLVYVYTSRDRHRAVVVLLLGFPFLFIMQSESQPIVCLTQPCFSPTGVRPTCSPGCTSGKINAFFIQITDSNSLLRRSDV